MDGQEEVQSSSAEDDFDARAAYRKDQKKLKKDKQGTLRGMQSAAPRGGEGMSIYFLVAPAGFVGAQGQLPRCPPWAWPLGPPIPLFPPKYRRFLRGNRRRSRLMRRRVTAIPSDFGGANFGFLSHWGGGH